MNEPAKTVRWKQRYANFDRSLMALSRAVSIESLSEVERAGLIQFFEVSFELGWKTLKDFLESEGQIVKSPRETIKQAFANEYIPDGHIWLQALEDRNAVAHIYNEAESIALAQVIKDTYFPLLQKLHVYLATHYK